MSIASEITRLQGAKADLKTAIENKGVTVPSATLLDGYADLVDDIPTGGSPTGTKTISITQNGTYTENVADYATAEIDVSVSGGAVNNQNKTVNPSTSQQSVTADAGYTGLGTVTVTAMPSGSEGTPTATKGAVSNHSVSVTPSVTNTAGYIEGGTKNGTAVSVSASELVSGSQTFTENGTYNVTNLASITIDIEQGEIWMEQTIATDGAVTQALDPHVIYHFTGNLTSLTITLNAPSAGEIAHYHFDFLSGSTAPTLTMPNTVTMPDDFAVEASKRYEVDVMNSYGAVITWTES